MMPRARSISLALAIIAGTTACSKSEVYDTSLNPIAERYVKLVLAYGVHDSRYVDAYYGPDDWRTEAEAGQATLARIRADIRLLVEDLAQVSIDADDQPTVRRKRYLSAHIDALDGRISMAQGTTYTFDEESQMLYDAVAPQHDDAHFQAILDRLEDKLAGDGPLRERLAAFYGQFVIPADRLDDVFQAAIAEARRRTKIYYDLPVGESFTVEYVTDRPWSGYNWYQGNMHSLIQVNVDNPLQLSRAVALAAHEAYPGHHVLNLMMEQELVIGRGWLEYAVFPLRAPIALTAEGSANFGVQMAFPGEERLAFERDVLFPLTGLDSSLARQYFEVRNAMAALNYASNEAYRNYLDGDRTVEETVEWMVHYQLSSRERAAKSVEFFSTRRSYIINYNVGHDIIKNWIETNGGTPDHPDRRWELFRQLISSPRTASDLQ